MYSCARRQDYRTGEKTLVEETRIIQTYITSCLCKFLKPHMIPVCAVPSSDRQICPVLFRSHSIGLLTEKAVMIRLNSIKESYWEACEFGYRMLLLHQQCMKVAALSFNHPNTRLTTVFCCMNMAIKTFQAKFVNTAQALPTSKCGRGFFRTSNFFPILLISYRFLKLWYALIIQLTI